jgi:hypothetical protein
MVQGGECPTCGAIRRKVRETAAGGTGAFDDLAERQGVAFAAFLKMVGNDRPIRLPIDWYRWARGEGPPPPCPDCEAGRTARSLPPDPYTMEMRLCDAYGQVSAGPITAEDHKPTDRTYLDRHNRLANMTRLLHADDPETVTEPFVCTGHAHLAGEHIRCTSSAHRNPALNFREGITP